MTTVAGPLTAPETPQEAERASAAASREMHASFADAKCRRAEEMHVAVHAHCCSANANVFSLPVREDTRLGKDVDDGFCEQAPAIAAHHGVRQKAAS